MDEEIKETILFVLEDDNEGMRAALARDAGLGGPGTKLILR